MATYEDFLAWLERRIKESNEAKNATDSKYYEAVQIAALSDPDKYVRLMKLARVTEESPEMARSESIHEN